MEQEGSPRSADHLIIAIQIWPGLYNSGGRIGIYCIINNVHGHARRHFLVGNGTQRTWIIGMGSQILTTTLRLRTHIHGDTNTVLQPLIGIRQKETSQFKGFLHAYTTMRQRAMVAVEGTTITRIMEINIEIVREPE